MSIANLSTEGKLPKGIHICSGDEFIKTFCNTEIRKHYIKPVSDVFDYAKDRGASHIFIGGSFVTANLSPNDLDCVIVFKGDRDIPSNNDKILIKGLKIDVMLLSEQDTRSVDITLKLFASCRNGGEEVGVIQVDLYNRNKPWEIKHQPSEDDFEIIKKIYNDRSLIDLKEKTGVLVSIHGLYSTGVWNQEIAPISSSQNWIFAPYLYNKNDIGLLFSEKKRKEVLEDFRTWIYELSCRFEEPISIIAHSYGTAIIGSYLDGMYSADSPPLVCFNSIILTGSILSQDFDWARFRGWGVGSVYNTLSENDEWVKYMPENKIKTYMGMSSFFGNSGVQGFKSTTPMLTQNGYKIFDHNNTIKRDNIEKRWMPYLNANRSAHSIEYNAYLKRRKEFKTL